MVQIDLSGKTAVVTGGSGELGRVIARTLAQAGADVAVHYFGNQEKAEKVAEEIRKMGRKAISVYADVTELDSVMKMKAQIEAELAPPEIVVDAAVIQYEWLTVLEQPIEDYESQFKSCVLHNVNMSQGLYSSYDRKTIRTLYWNQYRVFHADVSQIFCLCLCQAWNGRSPSSAGQGSGEISDYGEPGGSGLDDQR